MEALTTRAGSQLRYRTRAPATTRCSWFTAGAPADGRWERTAPAFARRGRVVRVDLRGHGASEAPPRGGYLWGDFGRRPGRSGGRARTRPDRRRGPLDGKPPSSLELAGACRAPLQGSSPSTGSPVSASRPGRAATHPWVAALTPTSTAATRRRLVETFLPAAARGPPDRGGRRGASRIPKPPSPPTATRWWTGSPRAAWRERDHPFLYVAASRSPPLGGGCARRPSPARSSGRS